MAVAIRKYIRLSSIAQEAHRVHTLDGADGAQNPGVTAVALYPGS